MTGEIGDPLKAPDVGDHLVVVIVAVAPLHRFDVATEFGVELVDERHRPGAVERHGGGAEAAGDPLVPVGDEDESGVDLEGTSPLFVEIAAGRVPALRPGSRPSWKLRPWAVGWVNTLSLPSAAFCATPTATSSATPGVL